MTNQHNRPTTEEPLTPADTPAPTHAERAMTLASAERTGTLATLTEDGFPYGSYVTFAIDRGDPVFLVSTMAAHTKNLKRDARASLLVHEDGNPDPLSNGRVTLVGECSVDDDPQAREAYLAAQPQAAYYADFKDFAFWKLRVNSVRYIGGYGRMSWVEPDAWHDAEIDPLADSAQGIVDHMNDDHAEAMVSYARAFTRAVNAEEATMVSIDRYGFEMSIKTDNGPRPARIAFETPIATAVEARQVLIALLKDARAKLAR